LRRNCAELRGAPLPPAKTLTSVMSTSSWRLAFTSSIEIISAKPSALSGLPDGRIVMQFGV